MELHGLLGTSDGYAVADSFALYQIATGHTPAASSLKAAISAREFRLVIPSVTFAVSCAMRTCWDEYCTKGHQFGTGTSVQSLVDRGGVDILELSPDEAVSAGKLYARCADQRVEGAEVLAACHASRLAQARGALLLSTRRAAYCYPASVGSSGRIGVI
ncbi:hypothetical protein [Streptomyces naphthomycinicus]|uniref:hypothetical protein n=1 Tax=Streptomyces naphthomycinicus TaxID=2872625 RepID=UPI001CEC46DB|nr:hypothetical protein [Streptomyces sp. TML10]